MSNEPALLAPLRAFAEDVRLKLSQLTAGEPEDQLRGPFENLMRQAGRAFDRQVVCTGEVLLQGRVGKPDYAVHVSGTLAGYTELKAPGTGVNPARFTGHNRVQARRFQSIPNLLYCDGNDWALYRDGTRVGPAVRLRGDIAASGRAAITSPYAQELEPLLLDFLSWQPIVPRNARDLAVLLAPLCRMLRQDVTDALEHTDSPLVRLAEEWRGLLFPNATDEQFADAYAQTVTFALLLARGEGADPLTLQNAENALASEHSLLSRALRLLTDGQVRAETSASQDLLLRVIGAVDPAILTGQPDPWLYFYEDFLAAYDPLLRRDAGVYYTPVEVVGAQVRMIDDLLTNRLGKPLGFADPEVVTLDPATGTGTYLLGVIDYALQKVAALQGEGAVPAQATALAQNLYGFELMTGPFTVAELRVSRALEAAGARLPREGTHIFLTDTLENPHTTPARQSLLLQPIADQQRRALELKEAIPVIVCLGNPPYDRHAAADDTNRAVTGGWVRWGDDNSGRDSIFRRDFQQPAVEAGHAVRVHNLYNLYVYFWRWALWKVFEHDTATGPGVVSFISASSYLDGEAYCGMRQHMRRVCDEIWVLDLGGEGRGTRRDENVFAIQTPVAIAVGVRYGPTDTAQPAAVHFAHISVKTRDEKLAALDAVGAIGSVEWQDVPQDWQAPFRPAGLGSYFSWPSLTDLLPWQHVGVKAGRTWVIAPDRESLGRRWRMLSEAPPERKSEFFKDSPTGMKVGDAPNQLPPGGGRLTPVALLERDAPEPELVRYAFRSFDRQWLAKDARLIDRPSPILWSIAGEAQIFLTTLLNHPLGAGPAVVASGTVPDLHHFRGSFGAREAIPLYRNSLTNEPNVLPGLLDTLARHFESPVTPEDLFGYVYAMLGHPAYTERFRTELGTRETRVPLTKDAALFQTARNLGLRLLWLHTYGERMIPVGTRRGAVPAGTARCTVPVPQDEASYPLRFAYNAANRVLLVGEGQFAPVAPEVYEFEVSGLKVVQSWLRYRMRDGAGRTSSPLDEIRPQRWPREFTTELLEVLWVLEATVESFPDQARLLDSIVAGRCFTAAELPPVPPEARLVPRIQRQPGLFDLGEEVLGS
jgi:hypothetical protein